MGALRNWAEQQRTDLWWIERDGSNREGVVEDITRQFVRDGLPWLERATDLAGVYADVCQEHDRFVKFELAAALARHLGLQEE